MSADHRIGRRAEEMSGVLLDMTAMAKENEVPQIVVGVNLRSLRHPMVDVSMRVHLEPTQFTKSTGTANYR